MSGIAPPARATELVLNTISFRSGSTAAAATSTQKCTRILTYVTPGLRQTGSSLFFFNCFYHTLCVGTHIVYVYHYKCLCMTIHVHTCLCYNTIYTVTSRRRLHRKNDIRSLFCPYHGNVRNTWFFYGNSQSEFLPKNNFLSQVTRLRHKRTKLQFTRQPKWHSFIDTT